ncbi:helix-turn-helix transcriptional regulator [Sphaerisporangium sp. NPDC005289]|uniref:helix-turn-helix domain-containing protein n=1 Tax=Sphaerisporangium sp. NPDC005289 TaxID=3155247 RepID=UPI0033ACE6C3
MPRACEPVVLDESPWHLLGAYMRHWREEVRSISQRELAKAAFVDQGELSRWERGLARPHADHVKGIDDALGAEGRLVTLYGLVVEIDRLRTLATKENSDEEAATERRQLLRFAATSAAFGAFGMPGEPVRRLLSLSLNHDFRGVAEWEVSCADHLHALRTRPPAQVAADLAIDLMAVRRQLDACAPAELAGLHRVTATLSAILANALTRRGDHGAAIRWWRTARRSADLSGDFGLRLLVRGEEAGHGLYGQRAPETVLRLVESAEQIAGKPSVDFMTTRAKALSMLGRHDEAKQTLHALLRLAETDARSDPWGFWKPDQIHFAESWVHAGAGEEAAAAEARDEVLRQTGDYQYKANIALHGALCTVVQGGTDEGVRQAAGTIGGMSPAYRSTHILETGRMVLRAVPIAQQARPAVMEFREVLATTEASKHA